MKTAEPFSESMTVNEAIRAMPRAAAVFHRFDVDACCGGSLPIGEAARIHGSDIAALMRALEDVARNGR